MKTPLEKAIAKADKRARNAVAFAKGERALKLRQEGKDYSVIAIALGMSISGAMDLVRRKLADHVSQHREIAAPETLALELSRLDRLYETAFARATGAPQLDPETGEQATTDKGELRYFVPDPKWMRSAIQLSGQRMSLLGLDVKRVRVEGEGGTFGGRERRSGPTLPNLDLLTPLEIAALEHLLQKAGARIPGAPAGKVLPALRAPASSDDVIDAEIIAEEIAEDEKEIAGEDAQDSDSD